MKAHHNLRLLPLLGITASFSAVNLPGNAIATTNQYWNADGTGGDGNWSTSPGDKNWNTTPGGPQPGNTFWSEPGGDKANFQDATGGTVTVIDSVQAAGIIQNGANYTLNAGSITLVPDASLNRPFIKVQTGTLSIDTVLAGTDGLSKTGGGNLLLSNSNNYAGTTSVLAGTLTLSGSLSGTTVDVAAGAGLINQNGGLAANTVLTLAGTLTMNASDTVAAYASNGGTLSAGPGTLTTTLATLANGSSVAGSLAAETLISNGAVAISGSATGGSIQIASGVLTNTGTLGAASSRLDLAAGATLIAHGTQHYAELTTSGAGAGIWQENLNNPATIAPGGQDGIGILQVSGKFINSASGVLKLDIAETAHDLLEIQGSAGFGGTLELNQVGANGMTPSVPINVVAAGSYSGNFTSLSENLDGTVWFNPENGNVTRIAVPDFSSGKEWFGTTSNQTSTWIALYDDVIDPGVSNVITNPGYIPAYTITSGIANGGNPDLLWALAASLTPDGLDSNLLNRLSPEVYAGFSDYAIQATRTRQRTALSAPALAATRKEDGQNDSQSGCKDAIPGTPAKLQWEFFAATDYFDVTTRNSRNEADYQLSSRGIMAGTRTMITDRVQLAAYVANDDGDVDGALIGADVSGWSLGLLGEVLLHEKTHTRLTAGISHGKYAFDGTRESVSANNAGWSPGQVTFDDVDSNSLELSIGVEGVAYQDDRFRLIPSFALRYAAAETDSFTETTGTAPGSPIALTADRDHHDAALAELGLLAEAALTSDLTLWGQFGASVGIGDSTHGVTGHFAEGSRAMHADADGLSNNLWFIGLGATYDINDSISVGFGFRSEFRSGAGNQNGFNLSSSFRF